MVHSVEPFILLAPLKKREINHPKGFKLHRVKPPLAPRHLQPERTQSAPRGCPLAGHHQHEVALLRPQHPAQPPLLILRQKLICRRLECAVFQATDVEQPLRTDLRALHVVHQRIELLTRIDSHTRHADRTHVRRPIDHMEAGGTRGIG